MNRSPHNGSHHSANPPQADNLSQPERPKRKRRIVKRLAVILFLLMIIGLIFDPVSWLLQVILVYETPFQSTDAVLVGGLGGSLEIAAKLVREGTVEKILITEGIPEKYRGLDAPLHLNYFIQRDLQTAGVPPETIFSLEKKPTSMLERQQMLRAWIREHGIRSYLVFSSSVNSRMAKMLHDGTFPEGDVRLVIYPSSGGVVWRKQVLGIHNTLVRMIYWYTVYRPRMAISARLG